MFKFALKNMAIKKIKVILIVISIVISASVAILAYNISQQVNDGIRGTFSYYGMIVGPANSSSTDLAMSTMFFTDPITDTISSDYVNKLKSTQGVKDAIPFTMGDSYRGNKIIGTSPDFLSTKELKDGVMFDGEFQTVIGYNIAKRYNLKVGDSLITSHGISEGGHEHTASPLKVVGILKETKTAYDNVLFTSVETVWETHEHHEEGEHDEHEDGQICAVLVKLNNPSYFQSVKDSISTYGNCTVIEPSSVLWDVLKNVDMSSQIVYILCVIIMIMNIFIISVITLLNMYDSKKEISLMRLIGIGMNKINLLYIIQNAIIGLVSTVLALLVAKLCLFLIGDYVASMGIVLDVWKIYPLEWLIMFVVFAISVLPTVICTISMSRKDGISE